MRMLSVAGHDDKHYIRKESLAEEAEEEKK